MADQIPRPVKKPEKLAEAQEAGGEGPCFESLSLFGNFRGLRVLGLGFRV